MMHISFPPDAFMQVDTTILDILKYTTQKLMKYFHTFYFSFCVFIAIRIC
jgi:hypothetical protein